MLLHFIMDGKYTASADSCRPLVTECKLCLLHGKYRQQVHVMSATLCQQARAGPANGSMQQQTADRQLQINNSYSQHVQGSTDTDITTTLAPQHAHCHVLLIFGVSLQAVACDAICVK